MHTENIGWRYSPWGPKGHYGQGATYIINRTPTKALKDITPEEAWSGRKPDLHHLRIFGSIAYVHTPKWKRHKLDANSSPYIFVGYDENTKGYRVYDSTTNKV